MSARTTALIDRRKANVERRTSASILEIELEPEGAETNQQRT